MFRYRAHLIEREFAAKDILTELIANQSQISSILYFLFFNTSICPDMDFWRE